MHHLVLLFLLVSFDRKYWAFLWLIITQTTHTSQKKKPQFGSDWDQGLTVHNSGSKTHSKVIVGELVATHWASDG